MEQDRRAPGEDSRVERSSSIPNDLPDNPRDQKELEMEEVTLDLPEVKDIPGQEFVHAPRLNAIGDTTISSDDEEGEGLLDDDTESVQLRNENAADVSTAELKDLSSDDMPTRDAENLRKAELDDADDDGEDLNEN